MTNVLKTCWNKNTVCSRTLFATLVRKALSVLATCLIGGNARIASWCAFNASLCNSCWVLSSAKGSTLGWAGLDVSISRRSGGFFAGGNFQRWVTTNSQLNIPGPNSTFDSFSYSNSFESIIFKTFRHDLALSFENFHSCFSSVWPRGSWTTRTFLYAMSSVVSQKVFL